MPTYEYICTECNHEFDAFQSISAAPLTECPKCKGLVKRKISAGLSPIFKGSGFYQTDYKDSKKSNTASPAKKESGTTAPSAPASDTSSASGSSTGS